MRCFLAIKLLTLDHNIINSIFVLMWNGFKSHQQYRSTITALKKSNTSHQFITTFQSGLCLSFSHHLYAVWGNFIHEWRDIHTYIIGYCNPSVRIIDLVSHTTYVVCVNFLQFNVDSERKIFEKLFHGSFIYSQNFC